MTSILTNTSAMNALQTLKNTNLNLNKTQQEIASGKSIGSARDNAAVWAISKVMESDVKGFEQISNSLALGQSTLGVARGAAESVTDLLTEIKQLVVGAQEENVDRAKIQTDIVRLREQIDSIVGAAQFNGLNLLQNTETTAGSGTVNILGSLDRDADGSVTARNVSVDKADLGLGSQAIEATGLVDSATVIAAGLAAGATDDFMTVGATVAAGNSIRIDMTAFGMTGNLDYVVRDGEGQTEVATELARLMNEEAQIQGASLSFGTNATAGQVTVTNTGTGAAAWDIAVADVQALYGTTAAATDGTIGGGLAALSSIDVTTSAGADAALVRIEGLIQKGIDASAAFGSAEKRIDIQADFVSRLTDSLKAGIGTLVDADMEEASARLQALQVQQQLGVQALSIANQSPQTLLSLFR